MTRTSNLGAWMLVVLALAAIVAAQGSRSKSSGQRLKRKLSSVRGQKQAAQERLRRTRRQVKIVVSSIAEVDTRLDKVETQLEATTSRLTAGKVEQRRIGLELEAALAELAKTKEKVKQRLKLMYMHSQRSPVSLLVGSNSLSQFADRKFVFSRIAELDRKLFGSYKQLTVQVAAKKQRQDQLVAEIARLAQDQQDQQDELEAVRAAKQDALEGLQSQQERLRRLIEDLDAEESSIEAQIAAYSRRVASGGGVRLPPFTGRFSRPVSAPMGNRRFGMRMHPILRVMRMHNGIDFGARYGLPIYAAANGVVISASYNRGFGNHVILDHGGGVTTLYAHASRLNVRAGQRVRRGQVIAAVGSTGLSTGPHLHWEVRVNGRPVNPLGRF